MGKHIFLSENVNKHMGKHRSRHPIFLTFNEKYEKTLGKTSLQSIPKKPGLASEREERFIEEHRASMLWKLRCKSHPNNIIHETFLMGPRCITPLMETSSTHYKETTQFTRELQERPTQKPSKWMGDTPTKVAQQHQRNNKKDSKKLPRTTPKSPLDPSF